MKYYLDETEEDKRELMELARLWESDEKVLTKLCDELRDLYNKDMEFDFICEICDVLLAKARLPTARKAELEIFLAAITYLNVEEKW